MWKIVNHDVADDFVVSTGITHTVEDMCNFVFSYLGLNYKDHIIQNPKFMRPEELPYLCGDSTKARTILGWSPTYTFESMMEEMTQHWLKELS
jgi:GDPmannose 4,6-dehydratase